MMNELFFSLDYQGAAYQIFKMLIFGVLSILITYLVFLVLSKILYKKKFHSDSRLPMALLWSIIGFLLVFSIYLGFLINFIGFDNIPWGDYKFYLGFYKPMSIIHLEIVLLATIIFFYTSISKLTNSIKKA